MKNKYLRQLLGRGAGIASALLAISTYTYAQAGGEADIQFAFDTPDSIESWELVYASESAAGADKVFDNGSLSFIPDWQQAFEYMGYATDLGGTYDFSTALITADVKYSDVYYAENEEGFTEFLAGGTVIMLDDNGRMAMGQFWGAWGGEPNTFTTHTYLDGASTTTYVQEGFDLTHVAKLGFNLLSEGELPEVPGAITYDNIRVRLAGSPPPQPAPPLVDFRLNQSNWIENIGGATSTYWDESTGLAYRNIYYDDTDSWSTDESIKHDFIWHPDLIGGRMTFGLTLPVEFADYAEGLRVELLDAAGRVAVLTELDAAGITFGSRMDFDYPKFNRSAFLRMDENFNLANVQGFLITIGLPAEPLLLNGTLELADVNVQVDARKPRNLENPRTVGKLSPKDLQLSLYFSEWFDGYEWIFHREMSKRALLITQEWQAAEERLSVGFFWHYATRNIKNTVLTQRVYLPADAISSGVTLSFEFSDATNWRSFSVPVGNITPSSEPGWQDIVFDTAELEGLVDLTIIDSFALNIYRGDAIGNVGTFRIEPPHFTQK
ncbi:hypothetical protein [Teredinibacter turnerae]|uniref:hypothetical protein n=1 Tax=Teredinibacter turnerae TaxID=2426 RepID=UPI0003645F99|nr:hypothetical protein [Teredinibacter turnerae]